MQRAVFLDRDGTISEEAGYINHIDRFRLYPCAAGAIQKLNAAGWRTILITNQSGIARGYFPEALIGEIHSKLEAELAKSGAYLDAIYYCPHLAGGRVPEYSISCDCRKPKIGMLLKAAEQFQLDLSSSFVIGDKYVDIETAHRAGARGVFVLSGYGKGERLYLAHTWPRQPDHIAHDVSTAVDWILHTA
jgi:D-glycero-D-manno-heptose 1,7-bisphosphate phosphatase